MAAVRAGIRASAPNLWDAWEGAREAFLDEVTSEPRLKD